MALVVSFQNYMVRIINSCLFIQTLQSSTLIQMWLLDWNVYTHLYIYTYKVFISYGWSYYNQCYKLGLFASLITINVTNNSLPKSEKNNGIGPGWRIYDSAYLASPNNIPHKKDYIMSTNSIVPFIEHNTKMNEFPRHLSDTTVF